MPSAAILGENQVTLGLLRVGASTYAIEIGQVREVVRWQEATPLPRAPRLIDGVIDLRGAVVPVVDLGAALGGERVEAQGSARIVITESDGLVMGLAVDAAEEVMAVDVSTLEDAPALATQAGYDAVRAVVRRPGASPVMVLSLEHILESVYRSARPSQEDAA